jgi:acyl carrier protein
MERPMTKDEIFARVARVLEESFDLAPAQLRPDAHLVDDLVHRKLAESTVA